MKKFYFLSLMAVLCLGLGLVISCGDDDDDADDDDDYNDDDDGGDDDDDDATSDTWTDSTSGLTWQVTPSDIMSWDDAIAYCDNLSLGDGGWHLPTISELRTLIRGCDATETGGSCGVTDSCLDSDCRDDSCYSCDYGDGPNNGCFGPSELPGECDCYWSSSPVAEPDHYAAWAVDFKYGYVYENYYPDDTDSYYSAARCVR